MCSKEDNKLSVIVPLYNGEKYIKETIEYIQESDYKNLEIIVVNDGSKDDGKKIVKCLQKSDNRIIVYDKENGGVVSSRNYGLERATGDYVCFVDQDDIVKPFMYSKLIHSMIRNNSDMSICSSGRSIGGKESDFDLQDDSVYRGTDIKSNLLYPMIFNGFDVPLNHGYKEHYPHIWTCVFKRSFLEDNNIFFRAYMNFEDDLLVKVEALSKADCVSTISYVGYYWRVNLKSETYAHHFVENIGQKQEQIYVDIANSLRIAGTDEKTINLFRQILYCKQYTEAVHYLTSSEVKKNIKFIKQYFEENVYSRNFENAIKGKDYLKKGRIKVAVLLPVIQRKWVVLAYWLECILDWILLISLHSQFLTILERKIKRKNNTVSKGEERKIG